MLLWSRSSGFRSTAGTAMVVYLGKINLYAIGTQITNALFQIIGFAMFFQMLQVRNNGAFSFRNHALNSCNFVIRFRFAFFERNSAYRTIANTSTKSVTKQLAHHARFAIYHLQSALVATLHTSLTAIAKRFVNFYYCSFHKFIYYFIIYYLLFKCTIHFNPIVNCK